MFNMVLQGSRALLLSSTMLVSVSLPQAHAQTYDGSDITSGPFAGGIQQFYDTSTLNASAADAVSGGAQSFFDSSTLTASAASAISGGGQTFNDTSMLNASAAYAVSDGNQNFLVTSTLNASAANAISGGTQTFSDSSTLTASAANAVSGGYQLFYHTNTLTASTANAISGGSQDFYGTSTLAASTANAISGGNQYFSGNSTLTASAANAVSGGGQRFSATSILNASAASAVSGGTQVFNVNSALNASATNAISGGDQRFYATSTLTASAANAISGGRQEFYDTSTLTASAASAVGGGTQRFYNTSTLTASAANAVRGGTQTFYANSVLNVQADNALTTGTRIGFNNIYGGTGGTVRLNGYSTTVGAITSRTAGSGVISNGAASASILTVDTSQHGPSIFSGQIEDGGIGSLGLIVAGGELTFAGTATHTGGTIVSGGTLFVGDAAGNGTLGGTVTVGTNGTLGGSGTLTGPVTIDGTLSAGNSPGTLTFNDNLTLNAGSTSRFELNSPGMVGGTGSGGNDLVVVGGNLALGGTLDARVAAAGYYRLFNYGGSLTGDFGNVALTGTGGFVPVSSNINTGPGQVNLAVVGAGQTLQFWDGADSAGNGVVNGGHGVWSTNGTNWTGQPGQAAINGSWAGSVAVFAGATGGTVRVEGTQSFDTLQFSTGDYELSGGTLAFAPASGSAATIQVTNGNATIASSLAEGAPGQQLVKAGGGQLILTGVNSYSGGTVVQAGFLIGNAESIRGDVANAGLIVLNQLTDASYTGSFTGFGGANGVVYKGGAGALTLTGTSSLFWSIDEGSLITAAERFTGDARIRTDGTLVFNQERDAQYAGIISGFETPGAGISSGSFAKEGAGALVLTGDSSAFTGNTSVSGGALVVNGSLGGALVVRSGSRLGGSGTVGSTSLDAGGIIAPGNSIGTLTVAGDLTLAAGSVYEVEVDPAGSASDRIHVTGQATLGGTVTHIGNEGEYRPSASYTILTADGGISGTFGSVTSNYAFLLPQLSYAANAVTLTLQRNAVSFCEVSLTTNQCAVGNGAESLGPDASLYGALVALDAASARAAFDQLSGDIHASSQSALIEDSRFLREAATLRLRRTTGGLAGQTGTGQDGMDSPVAETGLSVWGHGFGSWGHLDGRHGEGTARLSRSTGGLIAGVDAGLGESWRVGVLGGYSNTSLRARSRNAKASSDNIHLGLYGGGQIGDIGIRLGAAYSWHDLDTERRVDFAGFVPETLDGDYNARSAQLFGEVGYRIAVHDGAFEPFANLAWVHLRAGGFAEDGGTAALQGARSTSDTGISTLGLRAIGHVWDGLELYGSMGWRHAFGDVTPRVAQAFAGGDVFTITGNPLARNAAVLEAGIDRSVAKGLSLGIAYSGQISDRLQDHGLKGQVRWTF